MAAFAQNAIPIARKTLRLEVVGRSFFCKERGAKSRFCAKLR